MIQKVGGASMAKLKKLNNDKSFFTCMVNIFEKIFVHEVNDPQNKTI